MKRWAPVLMLALLYGATVEAQPAGAPKPVIPGLEIRATRCKTGCAAGKFRFTLTLFNNATEKIRINRNEMKYKLRISYKPGGGKGGKKAPSQPYKTISFMQSGSTEDWVEIEPGDFVGIRKDVELGKFDQGLCASPAITIYGTLHVIGSNSNPELEINEKIAGNCSL